MQPTPSELERILLDWQDFARLKDFAFRGVNAEVYGAFVGPILRAQLERSIVAVKKLESKSLGVDDPAPVIACIVYEPIPDSATVYLHWCWTHPRHRNQGLQSKLWAECGLEKANLFVTHLTVLSEIFCDRPRWDELHNTPRPEALFNPSSLYKGG